METKKGADSLEHLLHVNGFPATSIHGDRTQQVSCQIWACVLYFVSMGLLFMQYCTALMSLILFLFFIFITMIQWHKVVSLDSFLW